jgi:membrane-bound lytic murein transglycosylase D
MGLLRTYIFIPLVTALLLTSCKTPDQKHTNTTPPVRAQAPTIATKADSVQSPRHVEEKLVPKVDPVEQLIAKVEKLYESGRANYTAGHLEAAKSDFDAAFNTLLESNLNVRGDDRLQQEFDKLVESVNNIELLALQQGDGFTEQRAEPAPIDEANEVTFPVDPNIRAKAEEELKSTSSDLPLVINDAVASYINYFSTNRNGHGFLEHGMVRSGRYRDMIVKVLKEQGLPQDLIYLAQAESGFHPLALSRAGARGMWQFMASRGSGYGLQRNWWIDDRQDPEKATHAAARHLKDLYNQFGDWYLAMAAYNSGPGTVQRAVQRTGYADYWELYRRGVLPAETRNYVPIIIAITIMSKNPGQYGLDNVVLDRPVPADHVTINYPVDLRLVAECVDSSVSALQDLNPSLLRMTTPKDQAAFDLKLPAGSKDKFQTAIAAIPQDMRVWWRYHRVVAGDTVSGLAKKYRTATKAIADANNITEEDELARDAKIIIPIAPGKKTPSEGSSVAYSSRITRYTARRGDTVLSVADDFGVPVERLRKWNRLKGNTLKTGRVLLIHKPLAEAEQATAERRTLTASGKKRSRNTADEMDQVQSGRGKRGHAREAAERDDYSKSKGNNNLRSDGGKKRSASARQRNERVVHRVKKGETLSSIANQYNTTIADLRRNNRKLSSKVHAGDVLVIKSGRDE